MSQRTIIGILAIVIIAAAAAYVYTRTSSDTTITPSGEKLLASVSYSCDAGKAIDANLYEGTSTPVVTPGEPPIPTGRAEVKLSDGRSLSLNQTLSADGVRYANPDESFVFWSKGDGALVLENNQEKSYIGCVRVADTSFELPAIYHNGAEGITLRFSGLAASSSTSTSAYKVDESYVYNGLGPKKGIHGIKFTIPSSMATGTNLGADSYISVESLPEKQSCTADIFLPSGAKASEVTVGNITYSVASSTDAGAGNRYEETVYALPGTNPCIAMRYMIHWSVFENYPKGSVKEFDKAGLVSQFDQIRSTLVVNQ